MAEIPIGAAYAYVLLAERMKIDQLFGSVLVVGGVLMLYYPRRRRGKPRQRDHTNEYHGGLVSKDPRGRLQ